MIRLTAAEVAELCGGELQGADPGAPVPGPVVSDSRDVVPGALFVAVKGERVDGHEYAASSHAAGASLVLASSAVDAPAVIVDDTVAALGRLARGVLARLPSVAVVGVTGSSGKTSTKDLMAQVFASAGPTIAPVGSLNTEVGLPLTVLRADEDTRFFALEYSARGVGHIAYLTGIARPNIAMVLNVGSAHVGEFGSREAIAQAKGELVEALPQDGTAVLNGDDPLVRAMSSRTKARVLLVGRGADCDVRAEDVELDELARARFTLVTADGSAPVRLRVHGEHQVSNALAVAGAALSAGLALTDIAEVLSSAGAASRWRMEVTETAAGVVVVNDAYNANPESMRAAIHATVAMAAGRRTWAVLGPMAELGEATEAEHAALGRQARELGIARVVAVGSGAAPIAEAAALGGSDSEESVLVPDIEAAVGMLREQLRPGDVVLVKASRSAGLERLAQALIDTLGPAA